MTDYQEILKNHNGVYPLIEDENGDWLSSPFVIYACPKCGRTIKHTIISICTVTASPNLTCHHHDPDAIYQMGIIAEWPKKEEK